MTALDIIILIIFIVAAVMGYRRGFISQIGSVAAIIVGIVACRMFGTAVSQWFMPDVGDSSMAVYGARILGNCLVYVVAYYAVIIVARMLRTVTHAVFLGPLDRIGGAVVSVVKWFLLVSLLLNLYIVLFDDSFLSTSHLCGGRPVRWIVELAPKVLGALTGSCNTNE